MATVKIEAGRARFYPRGAWSNSVKYDFFDLVTNGGSSYICINTSGAPAGTALSNGTYWALLAEKGDTGPQGAAGSSGAAATITIGTVTTGAAGTNAVVTNVGTATAAKLNFTIPRGATGATGPSGVYTGPLKPTASYWRDAIVGSASGLYGYACLPPGGTWAYLVAYNTAYTFTSRVGVAAGGTQIGSRQYGTAQQASNSVGSAVGGVLCWRIQ